MAESKKSLVAIALLFSSQLAIAAAVTVVPCPGFSPPVYAESTKCPPLLTGGGLTIGSTTLTVNYTTDTGNGTSYIYVGSPSGGSCPGPGTAGQQRKDLISGTGATASNNAAIASAGAKTLSVTGLTAATNYCVYVAQIASSGRASNRITQLFSTEAASPGDPGSTGLGSVVYVVDAATGSDSNTGLGVANAWASLTKATNTTMPGGADLCVMDDSTYSKQKLIINHGGSENDPAYHGGCYIDTGNSNTLTAWEYGTGAGRGAKPKIYGELTAACIASWNCAAFSNFGNASYTACGNEYDAAVSSTNNASGLKSWIEIVGLNIEYTACRGINVAGRGGSAGDVGSIHHIRIAENKIAYVGGAQAIVVEKGWEHVVIEDNDVSNKGMCRAQVLSTGSALDCDLSHGASVLATNRGRYLLQENNDAYNTNGEGLNAFKYVTGAIQRGNRAGNLSSAALYMDGGSGVVESNIVWGNSAGTGAYTSTRGAGGIKSAIETIFSSNISTLIRSNISVSSTNGGFAGNVFPASSGGGCVVLSGAHTGANNAAVFTNSSANYPVNGYTNYTVANKTDGSKGTITANTATTITATLSGGTQNDWDTGDQIWVCKNHITTKIYGNSFITFTNNSSGINYGNGIYAATARNNLVYAPSVSNTLQCYIQNSSVIPAMNYNGWSVNPGNTLCRGANDLVSSGFSLPKTEAQFLAASASNKPTTSWVKPGGGSTAIAAGNAGAPASDTCLDMRDFGASTATGSDSWILDYADYPFTPTWATWVKCHPYYFDGTAYDGDLGAVNP